MKQEQLQAIRERCEKATPGPWFVAEEGFGKKSCPTVYAAGKELRYIAFCDDKFNFEQMTDNLANAKFIAHAREDVPALLAEVERLQEALDKAEQRIKHLEKIKKHYYAILDEGAEIAGDMELVGGGDSE